MATQTWNDIIGLALRDSGVAAAGQTPSPQMAQDAKQRVNMMISAWKRKRWLVYHLLDISCACTGATSYGIGPGQPLNTPRTDKIEAAYIRQTVPALPLPVDYPLHPIASYENYSAIALKGLTASPPDSFFFDTGYPTGLVYLFPVPNQNWELHVLVKAVLDSIVNLTDTVNLPDEYQEAIYSNLCIRLCSAFRIPPDPIMVRLAKASLHTLRVANSQVPAMNMPAGLGGVGRSYNPYSDR